MISFSGMFNYIFTCSVSPMRAGVASGHRLSQIRLDQELLEPPPSNPQLPPHPPIVGVIAFTFIL